MATNLWVRNVDGGGALQLVCFPPAGRGTAEYASWGARLPEDIELLPVTLPGRQHRLREQAYRSMDALIPALADGLSTVLEAPFACFGHSLGAWIAFELVRELRRRGRPLPCHLFIVGRRAPQLPARLPLIHHLPEDEFLRVLQERYGAIPESVLREREILDLFLPALRGDFSILDTYSHQDDAPLGIPLTVIHGEDDPTVTAEEAEAWVRHSDGACEVVTYPGGHFFEGAAEGAVLELLRDQLEPYLSRTEEA